MCWSIGVMNCVDNCIVLFAELSSFLSITRYASAYRPRAFSTASGTNSESTQETKEENPPKNEANEELVNENKKLLESLKDIDDKYKRALAESENVRIRMRKQVEDAKIYAIQGFCKDLLDVADVFGKAIESVPADAVKANADFKNLYDGVVMTEQQLQSIFRRHGLVAVNPVGDKFNPNEHHAMFEIEDNTKEPGTVSIVTKIGYKLHDRTIRPAMVGVVKASK